MTKKSLKNRKSQTSRRRFDEVNSSVALNGLISYSRIQTYLLGGQLEAKNSIGVLVIDLSKLSSLATQTDDELESVIDYVHSSKHQIRPLLDDATKDLPTFNINKTNGKLSFFILQYVSTSTYQLWIF